MDPESMKPYGLALMDYFNGNHSAKITIHRDDSYANDDPIGVFFRKPSDFSRLEHAALDLCSGYVLDVGAGAGPDSLALQERGLSVCAIDISLEACEIMRTRGVKEVYCTGVYDFSGGPFDTILMLCRGLGLVEDLSGPDRFLEYDKPDPVSPAFRSSLPPGHAPLFVRPVSADPAKHAPRAAAEKTQISSERLGRVSRRLASATDPPEAAAN